MKTFKGYLFFLGLAFLFGSVEAAAPFKRRTGGAMSQSLVDENLLFRNVVLPQSLTCPDKVQRSDAYKIYARDSISVLGSHEFTRFFHVAVAHGPFEGAGHIAAPEIRIAAKYFTFGGTLKFDGVCVIVTTTPFESIKATFLGLRDPEFIIVSEEDWAVLAMSA